MNNRKKRIRTKANSQIRRPELVNLCGAADNQPFWKSATGRTRLSASGRKADVVLSAGERIPDFIQGWDADMQRLSLCSAEPRG